MRGLRDAGGCLQPSREAGAVYRSHRGERSKDRKRLPMASCRQCQTSAFALWGFSPTVFFDSWLFVCLRGGATGAILALAFCQCWLAIFRVVGGLADGASTGLVSGLANGVSTDPVSGLADGVSTGLVSGLAGGVSTGLVPVSGTKIPVSTGVSASSSLSDFADSFSANADSVLP